MSNSEIQTYAKQLSAILAEIAERERQADAKDIVDSAKKDIVDSAKDAGLNVKALPRETYRRLPQEHGRDGLRTRCAGVSTSEARPMKYRIYTCKKHPKWSLTSSAPVIDASLSVVCPLCRDEWIVANIGKADCQVLEQAPTGDTFE